MTDSDQSKTRKLRQFKELFHQMMIVIPFFYTSYPSTMLAIRCKQKIYLESQGKHAIQEKLYYDGNISKITQIFCFTSLEQAQTAKEQIQKKFIKENKKYFCHFCKDISECAGTLFQIGSVFVSIPESKQMKQIINQIAQLIVVDGISIEEPLKKQCDTYPFLSFLRQRTLSVQNIYYRWRVYSYLMGDGEKKYRTEPFQIIKNSSVWYPPTLNNNQSLAVMNVKKVIYLTQILQKMKRKKYLIEEAMIFCVYNTLYASHITSIIAVHLIENLKSDFLGYFFLISDILFNSTTFQYRDLIQAVLPYIMYQYVFIIQNSKDNQIQLKHINETKNLFQNWEKKYLFEQNFIKGMKILLTLTEKGKIYQLKSLSFHNNLKKILQRQDFQYQIQKSCRTFGLPYFQSKKQQAKLFLNYYFWLNDKISQTQPLLGRYDGQALNQKDLIKIKSKQINTNCCDNLSMRFLSSQNWKDLSIQGNSWQNSQSQDYE